MELMDTTRMEKIARMEMLEVPYSQIATAMDLTPGRITQICESEKYKEIASGLVNEYYQQHQSLNDAWDMIEAKSAAVVLNRLQYSQDADFALKAAVISNKANRRGNAGNRTIDAGGGDGRAVINLAQHFVQKIQNITVIQKASNTGEVNGVLQQKRVDILSPEKVENLLTNETSKVNKDDFIDEAVEEYFGVGALA